MPETTRDITCALCDAPANGSDMVEIDGTHVCPTCKPQAVQRISEQGTLGIAEQEERGRLIRRYRRVAKGTLWVLAGVIAAIFPLDATIRAIDSDWADAVFVAIVAVILVLNSFIQMFAGYKLAALTRWRIWVLLLIGFLLYAYIADVAFWIAEGIIDGHGLVYSIYFFTPMIAYLLYRSGRWLEASS